MPSLIIEKSGKRYGGRITSRILIGRLPTNGIAIADSSVSRLHAWIDIDENGQFFIGDSGSISGTQVNGRNIEKRRTLEDLDNIKIGETHILFSIEEQLPAGVESTSLAGKPP